MGMGSGQKEMSERMFEEEVNVVMSEEVKGTNNVV